MSSKIDPFVKEQFLTKIAIRIKVPLIFIMSGLFICGCRYKFCAFLGSLMLALGFQWLNSHKINHQFSIVINTAALLWYGVAYLTYRHFFIDTYDYVDTMHIEWVFKTLATVAGLMLCIYVMYSLIKLYEFNDLKRAWLVGLGSALIFCLLAILPVLTTTEVWFVEACLGIPILCNASIVYRVYRKIMILMYGPPRKRKKLKHKRSMKRTSLDPVPTRLRKIPEKYCLFCYYPLEEDVSIEPVKCPNCKKAVTPYLWETYQTLEPKIINLEYLFKIGSVFLAIIASFGFMMIFSFGRREGIEINKDNMTFIIIGITMAWIFFAVPFYILASRITRRDKKGLFDKLWAKRIRKIQADNGWISEKFMDNKK